MIALRIIWKLILLEVFLAQRGICDEDDWALIFSAGFSSCKDFDNKVMDAENMQLAKSDDDDIASVLSGCIKIMEPVENGTMIELQMVKETEVGTQPMYGFSANLCEFMKDTSSPIYEAFKQMGIEGCPIEAKDYECKEMGINYDSVKDFMTAENEGSYIVILTFLDARMNTITCHKLEIACVNKNGRK